MELLKSASKIVFILLALSACVGFFIGLLDADKFMILATGAFSFYFANKGDASNNYLQK